MTRGLDYRGAGVDIDAADDAKNRMRAHVESTFTAGTRGAFGGFGGMFAVPAGAKKPILVASADGVGTKIMLAIEAGRHDTVGHDLVNHCVNDILVQGAEPLFFLDYVAFGALEPAVAEAVVKGIAAGCRENGCALIGGETAEMPGLYTPPDYDLAGFIVGWVEQDRILGADRVRPDDTLIALASSGLHTNGYSLARRIVSDRLHLGVQDVFPGTGRRTGEILLEVHRSYLATLKPVLDHIHAMAHITGGGIPGNLNRALPPTVDAVIDLQSWQVPEPFVTLARAGEVPEAEMFRTFNMGVGMIVITDKAGADMVMSRAQATGIEAWPIGHLVPGTGQVQLTSEN